MSATTFHAGFGGTVPAADAGALGHGVSQVLRAGVHRGRKAMAEAGDANDMYGVIETVCMLIAAAFGMVLIIVAFGFRF